MPDCQFCTRPDPTDVQTVQISSGRDHPPRPPEHADACRDCRAEHAKQAALSDPPEARPDELETAGDTVGVDD